MPVREATDGMAVEADHVYVIPPGTTMTLTDGHLRSSRGPARRPRTCRSTTCSGPWPTTQKEPAVAVVLSGNGTDGAIGLQAIKAGGGLHVRPGRDVGPPPEHAAGGFPTGTSITSCRPREIARRAERFGRHPYDREDPADAAPGAGPRPGRRHHRPAARPDGRRLRHYKQTTIRRRILRRMALLNLQEPRRLPARCCGTTRPRSRPCTTTS